MPNTANRGYTYPDSGGSVNLWEHFEELAEDVDADVEPLKRGFYAHMTNSATQSVANATRTQALFNTTVLDTPTGLANLTSDQLDIGEDGVYVITAQGTFASNATGYRGVALYKNGSVDNLAISLLPAVTGLPTRVPVSTPPVRLVAGDNIRAGLYQASGGALNTDNSNGGVWLSIYRYAD